METKSYFEAFGANISDAEVAKKAGLSYIAAATAMRLAGRPEATFVDFDGKPHLEMLNGSVVAVDLKIPGTDAVQRMYLPVMDRDNATLELAKTTLTDINNSRQRCLVKAIAAVYGDGMSLYMGCDGDGAKAVKLLGVTPETDLETVTPVVATLKDGGAPYIEWNVGLAACRITDPTFRWDVVLWNGKPYREVLGGLMVDVDTVYEGLYQRLSLPIMDAAFNPVPANKATVFDWNKTVMRALTKCIAFNTGYGLGVYADEFGNKDDAKAESKGRKATPAKADAKADTKVDAKAETKVDAKADTKVDAKAETKVDAKADTKVDAKADVNVDAKAETKVDAKAETKVEAAPAAAEAAPAADAVTPAATAPVEAAAEPVAEAQAAAAPVAAEAAAAPAAAEAAAPAAAEAAAPATVAPAAAVADSEAVGRFREVMRKRKEAAGVKGILSLYEALSTSAKFAPEDKPACFAVLVTASASLVDAEHVSELLGNLLVYKAMQHVPQDSRDIIGAKLTAVALNAAVTQGDEALQNAHLDLMSSGVALDDKDVVRLATLGNVPQETIDLLRDIVELAAA